MTGLIASDAVAIGVGAFFGAMSRYHAGRLAGEWIARDPNRLGPYQGWHTAAINIGGSFLLGSVSAAPLSSSSSQGQNVSMRPSAIKQPGLSPRTKLMLGVGFCGSFTTFSTYSVDVVNWIQAGQTPKALSYILTNNVGGIIAAGIGMVIVKKIFG